MSGRFRPDRCMLAAILLCTAGCGKPATTAKPPAAKARGSISKPSAPAVASQTRKPAATKRHVKAGQQPRSDLDRALDLARSSLKTLESIRDYTAVFAKRERVGSELLPEERNYMKIRHEPFSVYLRVLAPASTAGQEVIFVEGQNDGKLIAHTTGIGSSVLGRLHLDPHGYLATRGNRYTIKDVGLKNLLHKLLELGERQELFRDSTVTIEPIEFGERPCTQVEISSPQPIGDFRLAIARIVLDDEWNAPVHFESHEWPSGSEAKEPVLSETYTYHDLEFDVGLSDRDFDPDNSEYAFP